MNKYEIEKSLRKKYTDEYTIKMFTNFVLEFQECFSDIMKTEEVIDRIKKNVFGNILIVEEFKNKNLDGRYDDGLIQLKKSSTENERYIKYLLFHEMIHAITSVKDENGEEIMMGFSYLKEGYGMGLNEGMTEYLTQIRNERFEKDYGDLMSGYRSLVEQIRRLILIIGDNDLKKCFFYNPTSLKELLNTNKMSYDEIEFAFRNLYGKDEEIKRIGKGNKLNDIHNYKLHAFSETIFNNFSNAIGEVNTLEDFKKKYSIFQTYTDGEYDSIVTMFMTYYRQMGEDVDNLLKNGITLNEIKNIFEILKINMETLKIIFKFSKCFVEDKNKSAINLYTFNQKAPHLYMRIFSQNYGTILDHFSELDSYFDSNKLYDAFRYTFIGLLLKEHPEIDFSDVSYDHIQDEKSKINIIIFQTSNGKKYAYTMDGNRVTQFNDQNNNQFFKVCINDKCTCEFIYDKEGKFHYILKSTNDFDLKNFMKEINMKISHCFSEKEDIEYWIKEGYDKDGKMSEKLDIINKRIKARGENDFFDL